MDELTEKQQTSANFVLTTRKILCESSGRAEDALFFLAREGGGAGARLAQCELTWEER